MRFLTVLLILALLGAGCSGLGTTQETIVENTLRIYTTIYPITDFTQKIGGDKVSVTSIVPLGASPHGFEPSTKLLADLNKAEIIVYNGVGLEPYLEKMTAALETAGVILVDSSGGIEIIKEESQHQHLGADPHIWLSLRNAQKQGENILEALIKADPVHKEYYRHNYENFCQSLVELDEDFQKVITCCAQKDLIVTHDAFGYLCRDYGLTQLPLMGLNADAEPTPGKFREIIEFIKTKHITHIYFESLESPKAAQAIAAETKTQLLSLHPLGGITPQELAAGEDYFSIMKKNLESLQRGLDCK